ncbi:hypothetical protein OG230_33890 [Streptomyces sp. NBC_00234]|uniref:hypothetical protein n=1 Tax=Streptomyces sp. NBC_00234 TaxID=2903638 RepID=UPI002E2A27E7|nr:hypothetical protein [Streptomyces sp. NBC_00234]
MVYLIIFGSLLAVLLTMRTRWRLADEPRADGQPVQAPEADGPYGCCTGSTPAASWKR